MLYIQSGFSMYRKGKNFLNMNDFKILYIYIYKLIVETKHFVLSCFALFNIPSLNEVLRTGIA